MKATITTCVARRLLLSGWPGLERLREAPVLPHENTKTGASLRSSLGHPLIVAWCCLLLAVMTTASFAEIPEGDIRESAQRILADPAYQHFDHFGVPDSFQPTASSTETTTAADDSAGPSDGSRESVQPKTWWERLQQNRSSKSERSDGSSTSGGTSSSRSGAGTSSGSDATTEGSRTSNDATPDNGSGRSNTSSGDGATDNGATREDAMSENRPSRESADNTTGESGRPQRAASRTLNGMPAQRGRDGIERPVRFAPKAPDPSNDLSGSDWDIDLGLGGLFVGLGRLLGSLIHLVAYAALAAVAVLIVVLAVRAISDVWRSRQGSGATALASAVPLADDRSPGEVAADVYLQQALTLAQAGQYREALGQLMLGAMSAVERSNWIRYRRGLTLHDYLRAVRSRPVPYGGLKAVVQAYEPVEYGRRAATKAVFTTALDGYRQGFAADVQE